MKDILPTMDLEECVLLFVLQLNKRRCVLGYGESETQITSAIKIHSVHV